MQDLPNDPIIVEKYGGTSVGSVERIGHVAQRVVAHYRSGRRRTAVVVSAMAGETNRLLDLMTRVNPEANPRMIDMAVAAGEQVAVGLLGAAIEKLGVPAQPFVGFQLGIFTDPIHSRARIKEIRTEKIHDCWKKGAIPVIAGFQGVTDDFEITTLGRGGSDTSAVAVAVALKADLCEIYTDVDGVFTANPREVPNAKILNKMDFNVALEMASLGSKVLHNRCVELAAKYHLNLVVKNSFGHDEDKGTWIMGFSEKEAIEAPVVSGVTLQSDVARVTVEGISSQGSAAISEIFSTIAKMGINVDIIVHDRTAGGESSRVGFTVQAGDLDKTIRAMDLLRSTKGLEKIRLTHEKSLAKVSVVGLGMISHPGVASRAFSALNKAGIEIHMISTSEIKISCVVAAALAQEASKVLHAEFVE